MRKLKVLHVAGARPNFMKVAPLHRALQRSGRLDQLLVHTGQHYDVKMSDVFFTDLCLPPPDIHLGVGSGPHGEMTGRMMVALEKVCLEHQPDLVSVVGDVNSTLAGALVAAKLCIPLSHVEAGLRSGERHAPEEVNRLVTDRLADLCLTPCRDADENLRREGVEERRIHFVGNIMIDSLLAARDGARRLPTLATLGLEPHAYVVATLHRAQNVDDPAIFRGLMEALVEVSARIPVVFPVHPRTRKLMRVHGMELPATGAGGLMLVEPLGYLEFLSVTSQARMVLTDSGGLQEETTALGIPCLTLRETTERPITVEMGTNLVVGTDKERIIREALRVLDGQGRQGRVPELWDGRTGERCAALYERTLLG